MVLIFVKLTVALQFHGLVIINFLLSLLNLFCFLQKKNKKKNKLIKGQFIIACSQFRSRDCTNVDILLCCKTLPIIEASTDVRFGCFRGAYFALNGWCWSAGGGWGGGGGREEKKKKSKRGKR